MSGREIVTLQLGHYANFTGTHWWNLQEASFVYDTTILQSVPNEVNNDVLFREGLTLKHEVTFTPRLVSLDLKGSLKTLRKDGILYNTSKEDDEVKWSGDVTLYKSLPEPKNPFLVDLDDADGTSDSKDGGVDQCSMGEYDDDKQQDRSQVDDDQVVFGQKFLDLDGHVKVWSDFLSVHLHPRSIQLIQDFVFDSYSEDKPFDVFGLGQNALSGEAWDQFEDRVRFFSEECDGIQGFHLLFDSHNSFGGCATKVLAYLKDEFHSKAVLSLPVTPAVVPDQTAQQRAIRILNSALCVRGCCPDSSLYVPLSLASSLWRNLGAARDFPHLIYNHELQYHTSAILAASLDTMTLPYRQDSANLNMSDITAAISMLGRKVAALKSSFPFPLMEQENFADTLMSKGEGKLWQSLTPHADCYSPVASQSCVVRGIPSDKIKRSGGSSPRLLSGCKSVEDVLQLYLTETYPQTLSAGSVLQNPLKVVSPFPHIFHPSVTKSGLLSATHRHSRCGVESVPVATSLESTASMGEFVSSLHAEASRFNIRRHHHFIEAGLEEEDFTEMLQSLQSLAECYSMTADAS